MTNVLVKITAATAVVVTNWVSIGTFHERQSGLSYDVLQGRLATNYVGKMEAEGQTVEFTFRSIPGPRLEQLKLAPIATQGMNANVSPPLPIDWKFVSGLNAFETPKATNAVNITITNK